MVEVMSRKEQEAINKQLAIRRSDFMKQFNENKKKINKNLKIIVQIPLKY